MSYNSNIPQAAERLKDSQPELLENFKCISALLGVNHVISPWTSPATGDEGKHNFVELVQQGSTPTIGATEAAVYTKDVSGSPELFIKTGSDSEINITLSGQSSNGWTRLPSGILLKWGQASGSDFEGNSHSPKGVVTYPTGASIPVFSAVYQIMLSQRWTTNQTTIGSDGFAVYSSSTTTFTVSWTGSNSTGTILTYLAIGI